jgi:hypothetical protein
VTITGSSPEAPPRAALRFFGATASSAIAFEVIAFEVIAYDVIAWCARPASGVRA